MTDKKPRRKTTRTAFAVLQLHHQAPNPQHNKTNSTLKSLLYHVRKGIRPCEKEPWNVYRKTAAAAENSRQNRPVKIFYT